MHIDERLTFEEEPETPYTVKALSKRFAILTRPATEEDVREFEHEGPIDGAVIYTIIDGETMTRGPNDFVFNMYDYTKQTDIDRCLGDLETGTCAVSRRRSVPLRPVDERQR